MQLKGTYTYSISFSCRVLSKSIICNELGQVGLAYEDSENKHQPEPEPKPESIIIGLEMST